MLVKDVSGDRVFVSVHDESHHRETEEALRVETEKYELIAESAKDFIFIVENHDGDLRVGYINSCAEKALKVDSSKIIGSKLSDLFSGDSFETMKASLDQVFSTGVATKRDKEIIFSDGKKMWLNTRLVLINNREKPDMVLGISRDITEEKELQAEIARSEKRYETLVTNSNDGIVIIQDGYIRFMNQKMMEITGYELEDMARRPFVEYVAEHHRTMVGERYAARLKGIPTPSRYEFELITKRGISLPIEVSASLIEHDGRPAVMAVVRDMSIVKETDRVKPEIVSIASHQLRTPLTGVKWFAELLMKGHAGPMTDTQKKYIDQIYVSNERMIQLVNDMLDVSRVEAGARVAEPREKIGVEDLLDFAVKSREIVASARNVILSEEFSCGHALHIRGDKPRIMQVFNNMIDNAIKYSDEMSKIVIGCRKEDKKVVVYVHDTGIGIPLAEQKNIFERFFRASNVASRDAGSGLGLYISQYVVKSHGGRMYFESNPKKGTTFYAEFPIVMD